MKKILTSTVKIRFQDCDPFNHLNNSQYIDYFINAREDQILESYDIDIFAMIRNEFKGWVVNSNQIAYIKPAFTMESVIIESQLIDFSDKSLKVEMRMYNKDRTVLKSLFWTSFVHFDLKTQKPTNHSDELMSLFEKITTPVEETYFENRVEVIKQ